jgi:hypothetical protein
VLDRSATENKEIRCVLWKEKFHNHTQQNQHSMCFGYFYLRFTCIFAYVVSVFSFHCSDVVCLSVFTFRNDSEQALRAE